MLRIVRVLAPNPGLFTLEGTNTWIVGDDPAAVIDPGPEDEGHLEAVRAAAGRITAVLVTHDHPDHAPGAPLLARMVGAPVLAYRPLPGAERLRDGAEVAVGGGRLVATHTPGHTADHVSFHAPGTGALFTGDTVLGRGTSVIDPPDGDLAAYLRSLRRLLDLRPPARAIYPGHGPAVFDAEAKLREYLEHREMRDHQVLDSLRVGPRTVEEIVPVIYAAYPPEVYPVAARSVLAHLLKLEREGKVAHERRGGPERWAVVEEHACERCGRPALPRSRLCRRCTLDLLQEPPSPGPGSASSGHEARPLPGGGQAGEAPGVGDDERPPDAPDQAGPDQPGDDAAGGLPGDARKEPDPSHG